MDTVLLAKILDGQPASFLRSEGEMFIVAVNGREREVSRDLWRSLSEQAIEGHDSSHVVIDTETVRSANDPTPSIVPGSDPGRENN